MNRLLNKARRRRLSEGVPATGRSEARNGARNGARNENGLKPQDSVGADLDDARDGMEDELGPRRFSMPEHASVDDSLSIDTPRDDLNDPFRDTGFEYEDIPRNRTILRDEYDISPTGSLPLSEGETLNEDKRERMELQETYNENFDGYLPFLLRRLRVRALTQQEEMIAGDENPVEFVDNDDQPTVLDQPIGDVYNDGTTTTVMNNNTSNYNLKRQYIIVNEFMRHNTYIFPSEESFNLFKQLRSNNKKHRKSSTTTYDTDGSLRIIRNKGKPQEDSRNHPVDGKNHTVDSRNHIIPVHYKARGLGLPLFKVLVPYMSNFKKSAPFIVFHKYKEVPSPPRINNSGDDVEEEFETYPFCTVYIKRFQAVKRYTFEFRLDHDPEKPSSLSKTQTSPYIFKLLVFQHSFKPFSDFIYKDTRFRVLGTPILSAYAMNYNPTLKLLIIDNDQKSLCDKIINKKPGFEISSLIKSKKEKLKAKHQKDQLDKELINVHPRDYPNPYPSDDCGLFRDNYYQYFNGTGYVDFKDYIPNNMPPFGSFKDAFVYKNDLNIIPKRYSDTGKVEIYQDNSQNLLNSGPSNIAETGVWTSSGEDQDTYNINSTKSVDTDNLILNCVMLTLRESSIRATARPSNSSMVLNSRIAGDVRPQGGAGLFMNTDLML